MGEEGCEPETSMVQLHVRILATPRSPIAAKHDVFRIVAHAATEEEAHAFNGAAIQGYLTGGCSEEKQREGMVDGSGDGG